MKKIFTTSIVLALFFAPIFINRSMADEPPDPGGGPGSGDLPVGGGAPLGGGIELLLLMGAGYGAKKIYSLKSNQKKSR